MKARSSFMAVGVLVLVAGASLPCLVLAQSTDNVQTFGAWHYLYSQDAMTDKPTDGAMTQASGDSNILFGVACSHGTAGTVFVVGDPMAALKLLSMTSDPTMKYRFDKEPPEEGTGWTWSDDNHAFARQLYDDFRYSLTHDHKLVVRVFAPDDGSVVGTYTFSLDGAAKALQHLTCLRG